MQTILTILWALWASALASSVAAEDAPRVRLVLQVTVDGLRADLLARNSALFVDGGVRYLLSRGTVFQNAHYQHANTETIVGHATLATGAHPSVHGMIGNVWYDAEADELSLDAAPAAASMADRYDGAVFDATKPAEKKPASVQAPRVRLEKHVGVTWP